MSDQGDTLSVADRSFLQALRAWGAPGDDPVWGFFRPDWRDSLETAWERSALRDPAPAIETLKREHSAQVRPDLARVHVTWLVRGLSGETEAVRRAMIGSCKEPLRARLRSGLALPETELSPDCTPQPDVLRWVAPLSTERLVGDVPERADDSLVIQVLTRIPPRRAVALVRMAGLAKWAGARSPSPGLSARAGATFRELRTALAAADDRFRDFADRDVAGLQARRRHALTRLGTLTLARLLSLADPYRVRWALQHIPYSAAKFVRSVMPPAPKGRPSWVGWEQRVLDVALARLRIDGLRCPDREASV